MIASGAIVIVVKIVFTRPEELYGNAHAFGDGAGFEHVVVGESAAKSAAGTLQVNDDVVVRDVQNFGDEQAAIFRRLAGRPKFELAVVVMCKAVFRLHRSVREERIRIGGLNGLCGGLKSFFGVSILAKSDGRRFLGKFLRAAGETFTALLRSCAFVPFCLQLFAGGVGLPPSVGDYGDAPMQAKQILRALHLKGVAHAWHGSDLVEVGANTLPCIDGTLVIDGVQHSRNFEVNAVKIFAGDDGGVVNAVRGVADDLVILRIFELHGLEIGCR